MKYLIIAYNLNDAGGLSVALNFLHQLGDYDQDKFLVITPPGSLYHDIKQPHIELQAMPGWGTYYALRWLSERTIIRNVILKFKPDVIFTMGNYPIPIKAIPQAVLFHYAYLLYPYNKSIKLSVRELVILFFQFVIFKSRLSYASMILVQTKTAANRLMKYYGQKLNIRIVPNAVTLINRKEEIPYKFKKEPVGLKLLCLSRYYPQKNLEILIDIAVLAKEKQIPVCFIITIEESQHPGAARLLQCIKNKNLTDYIVNAGKIPRSQVPSLYHQTDGLILPTLLESFSGTYADAMFYNKPVFTSDMDFAREICGDAAYYFNPKDPSQILEIILSAFNDTASMKDKIASGRLRSQQYKDWKTVAKSYMEILQELASGT